jgi:NurA-like 5'-3' nuclease
MMDVITSLDNYSPRRQKELEAQLREYPDAQKSKFAPLCRTRWVERLNSLDVAIDLIEPIVDSLSSVSQHMMEP